MSFFSKFKNLFTNSDNPNNLPIADVAERFELMGRTGQGSMSKVWRARDRNSGRTVCLKILDKAKTEAFEKRFKGLKKPSEGEICMLLKHRNIMQTLEHGLTTKQEPYIIMELIEGVGLNFLVETKHKDLSGNRINFLVQYANGIEFMHRAGYLHRDICPRNVMITKEGIVKIIDFGLTLPYKPEFCRPGNRTGTTSYLAPELIKRTTTDHRVDLFALGVTAFEVFTGEMPWERNPSQDMLLAMVNQAARNPKELKPDLDAATAAFLTKVVDRDPNQRYQTAGEFRDALQQLPKR